MTQSKIDKNEIFKPALVQIFQEAAGGVSVHIETSRLTLDSVTKDDLDAYHERLLGHAETIVNYGDGQPKSRETVEKRIGSWTTRLEQGDPYSGLAIRLKGSDEVIGHIVLGWGDAVGESEVAFILNKDYWAQGYGTEAAYAVVAGLAPELVAQGFNVKVNNDQSPDDGTHHPLQWIVATAKPGNLASVAILDGLTRQFSGEKAEQTQERHGAERNLYKMPVPQRA